MSFAVMGRRELEERRSLYANHTASEWICQKCTLINKERDLTCVVCLTAKDASAGACSEDDRGCRATRRGLRTAKRGGDVKAGRKQPKGQANLKRTRTRTPAALEAAIRAKEENSKRQLQVATDADLAKAAEEAREEAM